VKSDRITSSVSLYWLPFVAEISSVYIIPHILSSGQRRGEGEELRKLFNPHAFLCARVMCVILIKVKHIRCVEELKTHLKLKLNHSACFIFSVHTFLTGE
jgi:hypothetical protein